MQILKQNIKRRIENAARKNFLKKGFDKSSMRDIAKAAKISTSNLYSYFKSKEDLFQTLISSAFERINKLLQELIEIEKTMGEEQFFGQITPLVSEPIGILMKESREEFLLLLDKSHGTKYENFKNNLIKAIEDHFVNQITSQNRYKNQDFKDKFVIHIIATNFLEAFLEIARHYETDEWIDENIKSFLDYHINGITTFF